MPDGTLLVATFALNIPIAAFGGLDRAVTLPLAPLVAAAKSMTEGGFSAWFFYQMPTQEHAWCWLCVIAAFLKWAIALLSLPEAGRALARMLPGS